MRNVLVRRVAVAGAIAGIVAGSVGRTIGSVGGAVVIVAVHGAVGLGLAVAIEAIELAGIGHARRGKAEQAERRQGDKSPHSHHPVDRRGAYWWVAGPLNGASRLVVSLPAP